MNIYFATYGRLLVSSVSLFRFASFLLHPLFARISIFLPFVFIIYVARFNDTKVTYNTRTFSLSLSCFFSLSFTRSLFFSRILVGCWVTKKNSSLNKYTIQKLLSYLLTASVKRIILSFFFFSPLLFKYLKKLSFGKPCLNPQT